jgi:hypothetical protein
MDGEKIACPFCQELIPSSSETCPVCREDLPEGWAAKARGFLRYGIPPMDGFGMGPVGSRSPSSPTKQDKQTEATRFRTLGGYSTLLRIFGWLCGGFAVLILMVSFSGGKVALIVAWPSAIAAVVIGLGFVVSSEVISCFLAIEENTRTIARTVEKLSRQPSR